MITILPKEPILEVDISQKDNYKLKRSQTGKAKRNQDAADISIAVIVIDLKYLRNVNF